MLHSLNRQFSVNARNGATAEDIARRQLRSLVMTGAKLKSNGHPLIAFDVDGFTRPGPDFPDEEVALYEVVTDRPTHTYIVHVTLYIERN